MSSSKQDHNKNNFTRLIITGGAIAFGVYLGWRYLDVCETQPTNELPLTNRFEVAAQATTSQSRNNEDSRLTKQIYEIFHRERQCDETSIRKEILREKLYSILKEILANPINLHIVGSSANNLSTNDSDVDMCLVVSNRDIDQNTEALKILQFLRTELDKLDFLHMIELRRAKIPILRFLDRESKLNVDLNVNNLGGVRNTHLINCYTRVDDRFQPLAVVVKVWADKNGINDASNGTLSSYSLALMVIHYLQFACDPPVLPSLQNMMPEVFNPYSDIRRLETSTELANFSSRNVESLGDLLLGFLYYYSYKFNFATDAISIRLGCVIDKEVARDYVDIKNTRKHWGYICIEEPFERTNIGKSVVDQQAFLRILNVFRLGYESLIGSKDLKLFL